MNGERQKGEGGTSRSPSRPAAAPAPAPPAPRWAPLILGGLPGGCRVCCGSALCARDPRQGSICSPKPRPSISHCCQKQGMAGGPCPLAESTHRYYQVQASRGAAALQSTKGCFPKHGDPHHQPPRAGGMLWAKPGQGDTWAKGDTWHRQVGTCLAQLCHRKVKGWATEQTRMGCRKGSLPS